MGTRTDDLGLGLPPGRFAHAGQWVESQPIIIGESRGIVLRGIFDTLIKFDDGTYCVIDFKTTDPKDAHIALYARQLHAYAIALEKPAARQFAAAPVKRMGLLCFSPATFDANAEGKASLDGSLTWVEMKRDDEAFMPFLDDVAHVLALDPPPPAGATCRWCARGSLCFEVSTKPKRSYLQSI
ncbi:MAG: PD-(D/E)XK nuclease family protein [Euryarchaeota archaeon]|nr:PD-(D/E)XK nuclease family protein [Euryarchaeota archaeon]